MEFIKEPILLKIQDSKPEKVRFLNPVLNILKKTFSFIDFLIQKGISKELNPFHQTGAIANFLFGIAIFSGIILLIWYRPSVNQAYDSLEILKENQYISISAFLGQLFRSLHRYSSDAAILFALIHFFKILSEKKIGGSRWLAWITGIITLGILWFEGWTGYWLVWDVRAQHIALGTSKMLDLVPIFAEPLSRSFLTDEHINTLLFFLIFFFHMIIPLPMILGLWLHIIRLNRANWITRGKINIWIFISLIFISLIKPAVNDIPAKMNELVLNFKMDYWYLLPLYLTDRISGGGLWFFSFIMTILLFGFPWFFYKRKFSPSTVDEEKCQSCQQCYLDCPYNAISMIPKENREPAARVNPALCVSCGICNASCLPLAVGIQEYAILSERRKYQRWKNESLKENNKFILSLICSNSIMNQISYNPDTGIADEPLLKDIRISGIPCLGSVHSRTLEVLLSDNKNIEILLVGCSDCTYREGTKWLEERIFKDREPPLRKEKIDSSKIKIIYPVRKKEFYQEVMALKQNLNKSIHKISSHPGKLKFIFISFNLFAFFGILVLFFSDLYYKTPYDGEPHLIVSFKHPGQIAESCRELTTKELEKLPVHMRKNQICERKRSLVSMKIQIDNQTVLEKSYKPSGVWEDGTSIAIEEFRISPGIHKIQIFIKDTSGEVWNYQWEEQVEFKKYQKRVILFDKIHNFKIY